MWFLPWSYAICGLASRPQLDRDLRAKIRGNRIGDGAASHNVINDADRSSCTVKKGAVPEPQPALNSINNRTRELRNSRNGVHTTIAKRQAKRQTGSLSGHLHKHSRGGIPIGYSILTYITTTYLSPSASWAHTGLGEPAIGRRGTTSADSRAAQPSERVEDLHRPIAPLVRQWVCSLARISPCIRHLLRLGSYYHNVARAVFKKLVDERNNYYR
ncbi:hypothetical protein F5B21DRAFT_160203 [Xylaria acuta]|nr:hypothetical protein F5B21DRAFT_160203 [Xylaria acuta]